MPIFLDFSKNLKSVPRTLSRSILQSFLGVRTLPRSISRSISGVRTLPRSFSRSISVSPNIEPTIPSSVCTVKVYLRRGLAQPRQVKPHWGLINLVLECGAFKVSYGAYAIKECVAQVQDILNLGRNQNPMIGLKVTAVFHYLWSSIGTGQQTTGLPHLEIGPIPVVVRLSE